MRTTLHMRKGRLTMVVHEHEGKTLADLGENGRFLESLTGEELAWIAQAAETALRAAFCRAEDCRRLYFPARKNQIYCGARCANRVHQKAYRERKE